MTKNYRQEIVENLDQYRIGIDDVFAFKCRSCGKCCRNCEDILLNSRDVYNIATALNMTLEQVIEKYCDTYIGQDSHLPIVRLMPKGANKNCPLLAGDRCSIHAQNPALKPTVCALFPLGRVVAAESATEDMGLGHPYEIQYILSDTHCSSLKRKQTVRAWLENFGVPIEDRFFIKWNETIFSLIAAIQQHKDKPYATDNAMEVMWGGIFTALYTAYDTHKEFYPQFEDNARKITGIFTTLGEMF